MSLRPDESFIDIVGGAGKLSHQNGAKQFASCYTRVRALFSTNLLCLF